MGMVMIYRQEFIIRYGNNMNPKSREEAEKDNPGNDIFSKETMTLDLSSKFSKNED